ncbi:MAG TPA: xanthine dehydrogenase family protein molybdopterin-binding subunit, partial [Rhodobacteraceae bacterium]|nr:xanthine dehydrogenase family protein molybdopterin-binding subunit [Paracoccaceae bacterium]
MGRARTIARRSFLIGSAVLAGGAAFGAWQLGRTPQNPLRPDRGATSLNPWLIIGDTGTTIVVPRAEMGQGVTTTLAAMLAEELEVGLEQISVIHGPPAKAYFNSALLAGRDFRDSGKAPGSGWSDALTAAIPKVMSLQVTGGSTSSIDGYYKMRLAGAMAREALLAAAADRLGVAATSLAARSGQIVSADGTALDYATLARAATGFLPATAPALKPRAQWRLLGKSQPRIDQVPKATGTATFGMDVRAEGMAFASLRMNPRLGAPMLGFDATEAAAMDGVMKVVDMGHGVAVIARNTWLAMQAVNAIEVDWGDAPYPSDTKGIFDKIAAAFEAGANFDGRDEGAPDAALAGDPTGDPTGNLTEAEYRAPYLAHATMEVMNATARFTGDALEVWAPNQSPVQAQRDAAKAVGLKPGQVTLHTTLLGGGFGRRANVVFAPYAAIVAKALPGVVVQTTWSREEDMRHDFYRPGAIARMRGRLEAGRLVALEAKMAAPSIMAQMVSAQVGLPLSPPDRTLTEGAHDQPYAIDNVRVQGYAADVAVPVGFWRSVGNSQNAFFWESFIDEMAVAAGADPLQFRIDLIRPEHAVSAQVLETLREISDWTGQTPDGVGRGVAFTYSFGSPVAEAIELVEEDGLIRMREMWISADLGVILDPRNIEAQLTGGAVFGLSAAIHGEITFAGGEVEQENFPDYEVVRMQNVPRFTVALAEDNRRLGGVGEVGTPPAAP